jgi:type II secretory pathway component PulM
MKAAFERFWRPRSRRERLFLAGGAALVAAAALYALLWRPMLAERQRLEMSLPALRADLETMRRQQREIAELRKKAATAAKVADLRGILSASVGATPLAASVERMEALGAGRVHFEATADFAAWLDWVQTLQAQFGVRVASCTIVAAPGGAVRVRATFVAPGPARAAS